jgi:hypothetical protein
MSRKIFDKLASGVGVIAVVVLLIAGGLMTWGAGFASSNVHNQLAQQQITFPTMAQLNHPSPPEITPNMKQYLGQYAGQQLLTGPQAEAYANHFIAEHLYQMPYHGVYSQISGASIAQPKNVSLQTLKQVSFMGTTLRGLLLEAYAFGTIATILMWGAVAAFAGALGMALLVGLGFWHAARVTEDEKVLSGHRATAVA